MRSMCGGFIFRNWGPLLKVHHSKCLTSMTKHDSGGSPPGAACDSVDSCFTKSIFGNEHKLVNVRSEAPDLDYYVLGIAGQVHVTEMGNFPLAMCGDHEHPLS